MKKATFALYFANRGFFPEKLIATARKEMKQAVEAQGFDTIMLEESATKFGAVDNIKDGKIYAQFLKKNEGKYDGVILCMPNFGDERGALEAFYDCKVPILIQAYPDEIGKMDFANRRDSYCGKFSIMDVFFQHGIKYTVFEPHVIHPLSDGFAQQIRDFASVCTVVGGLKRFKIGCIGARTSQFETVRFDELGMQKYGITVDSYDLTELIIRMNKMTDTDAKVLKKAEVLKNYTNFGDCPNDSMIRLSKVGVAIDDIIEENEYKCISVRCWEEMQKLIGVAVCVLLGEMNDRGIIASCETDVMNVIPMYALHLATGNAPTCLDWNNNYGDDENKCILFHCGPVPQSLMAGKGKIGEHKMFKKTMGAGCSFGVNEGRIAAFPFTYSSAMTVDGKLRCYVDEAHFTTDPIESEYFGCAGVAEFTNLQSKLIKMGRNGYRHHTTLTRGNVAKALREAYENYLGYTVTDL